MTAASIYPSIWLAEFGEFAEWQNYREIAAGAHPVLAEIDDRLIHSRRPFQVNGYCSLCGSVQPLSVRWDYAGTDGNGTIFPAWTEIAACGCCGSNSRMRALFSYLTEKLAVAADAEIYIAEQVTEYYRRLKARYPNLVGSEYLGTDLAPGETVHREAEFIRHEDITRLSFQSGRFDLIITQDVFEHVPDYRSAFSECRRVLKSGGHLLFTVPFFYHQPDTEIRAAVSASGEIEHLLPPEYHGNPLGGGALCFQHFGWDLLGSLKQAGFSEATAALYWGPHQGHFGQYFFVFSAKA
ncbi:MAG: methyltransferase domain-containing protein [Methylococcus sp.]|nr:methyltransferase domain-containing protein [Methylococcus sp.]